MSVTTKHSQVQNFEKPFCRDPVCQEPVIIHEAFFADKCAGHDLHHTWEQTPDDYYLYYQAAQRRVEQWVKKTDEELHSRQGLAAQGALPAARKQSTEHTPIATVPQPADRREKERRTSSSRHRTEDRSHSRPSSGSKKIRANPAEPNTNPSSRDLRRDASRKSHESGDITFFACLPYGAFPLVYVMTGSFGLSAVVAVMLVAVCISINQDTQDTSSRKRTH